MSTKLEKGTYPENSGPNDFQCFGPPALNDGDFDKCKIADMGSFSQEEKDSNKYYHAAIVKHRTSGSFYVYFEWGRVGATNPQYQFVKCGSEQEAQKEFADQCHAKNDKRGVWQTIAGEKTLTAKPGKDVYLVRQLATRSTGLPDAKTIKYTEDSKKKPDPAGDTPKAKGGAAVAAAKKVDNYTSKLLADLMGGTITYTRGSMADSSLPTQGSIDRARNLLQEAQKRLVVVGDNLNDQIADRDLRDFSGEMYRRIPKRKAVGTPDSVWILNQDNILAWQADLDAFESALMGHAEAESTSNHVDPYQGLPINMSWVDPKSELGKFLYFWWPKASANRHYYLKEMKIKNIWKVERHGDDSKLTSAQDKVLNELKKTKVEDRPLFQPSERMDVEDERQRKVYADTNTALLFHGTRSVNVTGILNTSFRLPKQLVGVQITGAMFGGGIYFADDWRKSAGYTSLRGSVWSQGSGAVAGREAFMFACDVVLGQPHIAPGPRGFTGPPNNNHSIFGMGRVHGDFVAKHKNKSSGVENNEWIVFQSQQTQLRYLAEFAA